MMRSRSCSFDFEGGGHARYTISGRGKNLGCPTGLKATIASKQQFRELSNRAGHDFPTHEYFNAYAAALVENGFTVTPTRGKGAFLPRWHNPTPTDRVWLGKMVTANRYAGCNIGIVCGRVVGIDIDADDPAKAAQFEALAAEHLGPTPFQRVGRAPRVLWLYRPGQDEIISSSKFGCIEILAGGKQFVAYGIHPDTGKPYQWLDSRHTPATATINDLPIITAASVQAFAEAVRTALGSPQSGMPAPSLGRVAARRKTRLGARQGEMLGSMYDARIVRAQTGGLSMGAKPSFRRSRRRNTPRARTPHRTI
jgi:hypothetical protein